jgi:hypothetical protein
VNVLSILKSTGVAFALFVSLGGGLLIFWTAVLGVAMQDAWGLLPDGRDDWIGGGAMAFAVLSGLALYFWALVRTLRSVGIAPERVKWHALTTGLLPLAITVGFGWFVIANMRLGW